METIEVDFFICSAIIQHVFTEPGPMLNAGDIPLNTKENMDSAFHGAYRLVGGDRYSTKSSNIY